MSDPTTGRELTPHEEDQTPAAPPTSSLAPERFSAGERAHMVGLTEERSAEVVRQSGNARKVAFLAVLVIAIFIPVYWFYDLGIPALGVQGRMEQTAEQQFVTDVERGYALYLANCARCHGDDGKGGVGPPLNDQAKLYNAIGANGGSGTGHLNPDYIHKVLEVGGRYVCGDANSVMPVWLQPGGPLNYREVEELVRFITSSTDVSFTYDPNAGHEGAANPAATPHVQTGWRDPNYEPAPGATAVPACWRNPSGQIGGGGGTAATPAPIGSPGTADSPRVIKLDLTASITITDPDGNPVPSIAVKPGETVEFEVTNSAGFSHDFFIGTQQELSTASGNLADAPGIPEFESGTKTFTWTVPQDAGGLQFACTVPGHYGTMHGDFVTQE
jgi:uncharacterized cupredoxin-like copper-binding protein